MDALRLFSVPRPMFKFNSFFVISQPKIEIFEARKKFTCILLSLVLSKDFGQKQNAARFVELRIIEKVFYSCESEC